MEQAVAESARRQERERTALARPLRRRTMVACGAGGGRGDETLLESALAHRARADSLQAEVVSLTKQVRQLTFRSEELEERIRHSQAQQRLTGAAQPELSEAQAPAAPAQEHDARVRFEELLREDQEKSVALVKTLSESLRVAEDRVRVLEAELKQVGQQPSASEVRWQAEALKLRDTLAEVKRAWRAGDTRGMMQRDKELRQLGLDGHSIEEKAMKSDLVGICLELCRILKAKDITEIAPKVAKLANGALSPDLKALAEGAGQLIQEMHSSLRGNSKVLTPSEVLSCIEELCHSKVEKQDTSTQSEDQREAWVEIREVLELEEGANMSDCVDAVHMLQEAAADAFALSSLLHCKSSAVSQRVREILRLADQRLAAHRIVDALQKLLRVPDVAQVLPTLKEVLDVAALRRRMLASEATQSKCEQRPSVSSQGGSMLLAEAGA